MNIYVTRDSVCAGDDSDALHPREAKFADQTVEHLIPKAIEVSKLPSISGGLATWCISSNVPLAVTAQQWKVPKMVRMMPPRLKELDIDHGTIRFHISYFAQQDPNLVHDVLKRLQVRVG